jgi:acylphosphatase
MAEDITAKVLISGRVQGVWFRAYTRDMAASLGLKGYVKNLPDGRVEAVFKGAKPKVMEAIGWCYQGSPHSRVSDVDVDWIKDATSYAGFDIRR